MKKSLLILGLAISTASFAQYNRMANQAPAPGDIWYSAVDTLPNAGVTAGEAGENKEYSILDVDFDMQFDVNYISPEETSSANDFPEATVAFEQFGYTFAQATANGADIIGTEVDFGEGPRAVRWEDPLTFMKFPYTYGDTYSDQGRMQFSFFIGQEFQGVQIDSGRFTIEIELQSEVDGHGSLDFHLGKYDNVIRERVINTETQNFEICVNTGIPGVPCQWQDANEFTGTSGEPETTIEYNFYGPESKFPYASLEYDENENSLLGVQVNFDDFSSSIAEIKKNEVRVFPNPAEDFIFLNTKATQVEVKNLNGQTILTQNLNANNPLDISQLESGVYLIQVSTTEGISSGKFIKK